MKEKAIAHRKRMTSPYTVLAFWNDDGVLQDVVTSGRVQLIMKWLSYKNVKIKTYVYVCVIETKQLPLLDEDYIHNTTTKKNIQVDVTRQQGRRIP